MLHEPSFLTKKAPKQSILSVWILVFFNILELFTPKSKFAFEAENDTVSSPA